MDRLHVPWLFFGPNGSGKTTKARAWIEEAHKTRLPLPLEVRNFTVGDGYEARVFASPYHFEIDIPNLSMQDKQIIGELLTTFFSSGDVFCGLRSATRKLVILRRAHALSLPAAIRVRAIVQQYVLPADASGMIWITAREMTGPLAVLEDAFVRYRIPRMPLAAWEAREDWPAALKTRTAWDRCEGRVDRARDILRFFPDGAVPAWPRRVQDFYDELVHEIIRVARSGKPPTLAVVSWIRARIYQALSYCQNGPDVIDSCAAGVENNAHLLEPQVFWKVMQKLAYAEPHTSYRTPLSLEAGILGLYETVRAHSRPTPAVAVAVAAAPVPAPTASVEKPAPIENEFRFFAEPVAAAPVPAAAAPPKTAVKRRTARPKAADTGGTVG
jgi:hypothetical protein